MKRDGVSMLRLVGLLAGLAVAPVAAAEKPEAVTATLVAEAPAEGLLHVGVHFRIEPGWHIYWKNPGEAGLSTLVEVAAPGGSRVEATQWPAPIRFSQPGGIVGYGYESEVVLAVEVEPSAAAGGGEIEGFASWLACKERCVQGSARLRSTVEEAVAQGRSLGAWEGFSLRLPRQASPDELRVTVTPGAGPDVRTLWLSWTTPPAKVELFPETPEELKLSSPPVVKSRGATSKSDLSFELINGAAEWPSALPAVVVAEYASGRRVGYDITITLNQN